MPRFDMDRMVKVDEGRHHVDVDPRHGLARLVALPDDRQAGLAVLIWLWQFMHVWLVGTAAPAVSIVLWQYRQSSPSSPTCFAWLYGTGWIGA